MRLGKEDNCCPWWQLRQAVASDKFLYIAGEPNQPGSLNIDGVTNGGTVHENKMLPMNT